MARNNQPGAGSVQGGVGGRGLENKTRQGSKWGQEGREPGQQEHSLGPKTLEAGGSAGHGGPGSGGCCPAVCPTQGPQSVPHGVGGIPVALSISGQALEENREMLATSLLSYVPCRTGFFTTLQGYQ